MTSLVLDQVSKRFAADEVLTAISLSAQAGERIAVTGESGSGKTTLLRIIAGLEPATAGRVRLDSVDVSKIPPNRRRIGFVFQDYATYPRLTVAENLTVSLVGNAITKEEKESRLREIAAWLELDDMLQRVPAELSGGQVQRLALGKALMGRPKLLLLDEPFSQLDVRLAEQLRRLLEESHQRYGMTQVMVTHQPLDALCSVDKLAVLDKGRLVQFDTPSAVRQRPNTRFAAELTSPCGLNVLPQYALAQTHMPVQANANDQSHIAFRPETVHIADDREHTAVSETVSFRCRLGVQRDLGIVRLQEAFVAEHKILILCSNVARHTQGEEVECSVRRDDMLIFPA